MTTGTTASESEGASAASPLPTRRGARAGVEGKKSRSLISIYLMLKDAGYTNVIHVEGGMRDWGAQDMPVVGEDIEAWAKKASKMP